jgi:platelet-activating factor acetylhydrolase
MSLEFRPQSEVFTVWVPHMELLRSIVQKTKEKKKGQGWLMTLSGTKHTDFSDL